MSVTCSCGGDHEPWQHPDPQTPATEAGRRHADWYAMHGDPLLVPEHDSDILAIEAEAREGYIDRHEAYLLTVEAITAAEKAGRADALREAADAVRALPGYAAPVGTHGSAAADAYWRPSVSQAAVLAILDPQSVR